MLFIEGSDLKSLKVIACLTHVMVPRLFKQASISRDPAAKLSEFQPCGTAA